MQDLGSPALRLILCYTISVKCSGDGPVITEPLGFKSPTLVYAGKKCFSRTNCFTYCFKNTSQSSRKRKKNVLKEMLRKSKAFLNPNFLCYFLLLSLHAASVGTDSSLHSQLHLVTAEESGPTNTLLLAAGKKISWKVPQDKGMGE